MKKPRQTDHASPLGRIRLLYGKASGTLTYVQKGGNQSFVDSNGVSLDAYVHALYSLTVQSEARSILMIGCGGGTLGTMLHRAGRRVTIVDIDAVSFRLAKRHFGLPRRVKCHVGDGLAFMQKTRRRFDAVIVDAFVGEKVPPQFTGGDFCRAARRCLKTEGVLFMNFCLDGKRDRAADSFAARLKADGWAVRLLDEAGPQRNAIVMGGTVKMLRRPRLLMAPQRQARPIARTLRNMRFRKWRKGLAKSA